MKNLKMQDYGLMPLTESEKSKTDGGNWWIVVGEILISAYNSKDEIIKSFNDGYNSVK